MLTRYPFDVNSQAIIEISGKNITVYAKYNPRFYTFETDEGTTPEMRYLNACIRVNGWLSRVPPEKNIEK